MAEEKLQYFAETAIRDLPQAEEIVRRHPQLEWIDDYQSFQRETVTLEKRSVIFARKRGPWIKPFYCYYQSAYQHFSLDVAEGCLFDCVYCYLLSYLNHQALVLFLPEPSLTRELSERKGSWISTGLLSDSFLAEEHCPLIAEISRHIPADSVLELRSKSSDVSFLSDPTIHRDRIVVSWSLNPAPVVSGYEYRTATLAERLEAAQKVVQWGYRVAFHLDPVFHFDGWEDAYGSLIAGLKQFPVESVAFLTFGLFRYMPDLGAVIRKRFPLHPVMTGEFFPDSDTKYHYFRGIRRQMYRRFEQWLAPWEGSVPIFRSMEPDESLSSTTESLRHGDRIQ